MTIDNGNHLLLSGNHAALGYLRRRSAREQPLIGPATAEFPFVDLASGERWTLRINDGLLRGGFSTPSGACRARARSTICALARLLWARRTRDGRRGRSTARARSTSGWCGRCCSRRSTPIRRKARRALAGAVIRETLATGGQACRPLIARDGLGADA